MGRLTSLSISKQFYLILKKKILDNEHTHGDKLPSIRELASKYELSKTTVSSAIAILENEGLVEVIQGKGIFVKRSDIKSKLIGVMLYNFQEETRVEAGILNGIQKNLGTGYFLSMMDTANDMDVICKNTEYLINAGAEGLIILPPKCPEADEEDIEKLNQIIDSKIPVSFILRDLMHRNSDFIAVDYSKAIYETIDYLLKSGKKKIALITHDYQVFALQEVDVYEKVYQDNNCIYDPRYLKDWGDLNEMKTFLKGIINEIDALITSSHLIYSMKDIINKEQANRSDELHIVGINNDLFAKAINSPTITINFPAEQIGAVAISLLRDRMETGKILDKRNMLIEAYVKE